MKEFGHRLYIAGLIILTAIVIGFIPVIMVAVLIVLPLFVIIRRLKRVDFLALKKIIIAALIVRTIALFITIPLLSLTYSRIEKGSFLHRVGGHSAQLFKDIRRELDNGRRLARYFRGEYGNIPPKKASVEGYGFLHFGAYTQGILNFLFGESIYNLCVYIASGVWLVFVVYILAKEVFGYAVAKMSAWFVALVPSLIIWSIINVRMTLAIISFVSMGYCFVKFSKKNHIKYLISLLPVLVIMKLTKPKFMPGIYISLFLTLCYGLRINLKKRIALISALIVISSFFLSAYPPMRNKLNLFMVDVAIPTQKGYAVYKGSSYKIFDEYIYHTDIDSFSVSMLIRALPKGATYFLLAPFPWRIDNTLRLYSYPQIIFWYIIFALSLIGVVLGLRHRFNAVSLILIFMTPLTITLSLVLGNEGIAARHRDLIAPFIYIFASVAICNFLGLVKDNFGSDEGLTD